MSDQTGRVDPFDLAASMTESLDAVLAMLLLTRRAHVENVALVGPGLARIELSGEAIERGLAALAQVATYAAPTGKRARVSAQSGGTRAALRPFLQALKDFAFPPIKNR